MDASKQSKVQSEHELRASRPKLGVSASGLEGRLRGSLADAMREYISSCTLEGIKYASHMDTVRPLRLVYVFLMIGLSVLGFGVLAYFSYEYRNQPPLQINLVQSSPQLSVNFPAVGICSNSIVSKKELEKYAAYLNYRKTKVEDMNVTYTLEEITENLAKFAALVTLQTSDVEMLDFMQFLYNINPTINITEIMYKLSPKCSSMLSRCRWRGRQLSCDQLFGTRVTTLGYCCIFNSRYRPEDEDTPAKKVDLVGQNFGLAVSVLENPDDFAVIRQPATNGFTVLLFEGIEFPLMEGGAVRKYIVGTNASVYFQLTAHIQEATEELQKVEAEKRGCELIKPSSPRAPGTSYSWCLTECRRFIIAAICNCQPFWYPLPPVEATCTLEHLYCLNKHKEKFIYYDPGEVADGSLDEEMQDSLDCQECLPDCARTTHTAKMFESKYFYPKKVFTNLFSAKMALVNKTIIRFYYDTNQYTVHRVDLNAFWYEMVAKTSCQSLLLVGASLVSAAELVFHLTFRWGYHFVRRTRAEWARRRNLAFH